MKVNNLKNLLPRFDVDTFEHLLGHVSKATGKLHGLIGDTDHLEAHHIDRQAAFTAAEETNKPASVYIADLVICAAALAARCPSGEIDLEKAIEERMADKRGYLKQYEPRKDDLENAAIMWAEEQAELDGSPDRRLMFRLLAAMATNAAYPTTE